MESETHKVVPFRSIARLIRYAVGVGLALWVVSDSRIATTILAQGAPANSATVKAFEERLKHYTKLRQQSQAKLPRLSADSQPAEIDAHSTALLESIRTARVGAKPGEMFTPDIAGHIRSVIKEEFTGVRLKALRETVLEADVKGVPMRINAPYPETKELVEMPPTLLLKLPLLPKELSYRFVGRNLLLVDKEARLIVDYMAGALP